MPTSGGGGKEARKEGRKEERAVTLHLRLFLGSHVRPQLHAGHFVDVELVRESHELEHGLRWKLWSRPEQHIQKQNRGRRDEEATRQYVRAANKRKARNININSSEWTAKRQTMAMIWTTVFWIERPKTRTKISKKKTVPLHLIQTHTLHAYFEVQIFRYSKRAG